MGKYNHDKLLPTKWIKTSALLQTKNVIQSSQEPQRNNKIITNPSPKMDESIIAIIDE
jgi:hypothetical protein